jgi:hypothetical protein
MKNVKKVIRFRQELFWDVDPKTIDPKKHAVYIIERILELGDVAEVKWITSYYPHALIRKVMRTSNVVSDKSKSLWAMVF